MRRAIDVLMILREFRDVNPNSDSELLIRNDSLRFNNANYLRFGVTSRVKGNDASDSIQ